jgi:hypothetical protein
MLEFAAAVQVPAGDVAGGRASPGMVAGVPHYWIADTDIESKTTFGVVMLLFSIADTGTRGTAPIVTIPANQ